MNDMIDHGLATFDTICGCSEEEIRDVERHVGVFLPEAYRVFLRFMGRSAGRLFRDIDILFPVVLELTSAAVDILRLAEHGKMTLPTHSFVFSMRQGLQFLFFVANNEDDDPGIHSYFEMDHQFTTPFSSIWEFVEEEVRISKESTKPWL
jgi:hypothetical protein